MVEGLGNRSGKRRVGSIEASRANRGGYRPRKLGQFDYGEVYLHADAVEPRLIKVERATALVLPPEQAQRIAEGDEDLPD